MEEQEDKEEASQDAVKEIGVDATVTVASFFFLISDLDGIFALKEERSDALLTPQTLHNNRKP